MAKGFIHGNWHVWETMPDQKIMLSDESEKKLIQFDNIDDCINWLYMNGHKDAARALNATKYKS